MFFCLKALTQYSFEEFDLNTGAYLRLLEHIREEGVGDFSPPGNEVLEEPPEEAPSEEIPSSGDCSNCVLPPAGCPGCDGT